MSQEKTTDRVISLEELFLSQEFGQQPGGGTAPAGPLVPLVPTEAEAPRHASTTHRRRHAFAALSGTAAALLVGLGLIGGPGRPTPVVHSASPSTPSGRGGPPPGFGRGAGIPADTSTSSGPLRLIGTAPSRGTSVSLADITTATQASAMPRQQPSDVPGATGPPAGWVTPAGSGPGTGSTPPAPSGNPLGPVTSSVGGVVPGAGTAVSGLVTTITTGLPAATPLPSTASPLATG
jgi:hypothetical protein